MNTSRIDDSQCPLCREPNLCALSQGASGENCWCQQKNIPPALLASIPAELKNNSCLCQACIDRARQLATEIQ